MITLGLSDWQPPKRPRQRASGASAPRIPSGRRVSLDRLNEPLTSGLTIVSPVAPAQVWRDYDMDRRTFEAMPLDKLIELLVDVSPEISKAVFDFLRMVNPGWSLKVYAVADGETDQQAQAAGQREENAEAKKLLNAFLADLRDLYGSPNVVINAVILGGYLRGGFLAEVVLSGRTAVDLATPDPQTLSWQQRAAAIRGKVWQFGQYQQHKFVDLSAFPTIRYVPIDRLPGQPWGRAPVHPALFPTLFLISLLRDLKRVVAQQGYPRLDLSLSLERLAASLEIDPVEDADGFKAAVAVAITQIEEVYASLEPDDAYIHTDDITVNRPVGTIDASSLGAVDKIVAVLERMMVRALKTMPLMMSLAEGTSEANANRQWEIFTVSIKSIQHLVESLLESLFAVVLRAAGLQGVIEFRFAELRAAEMLRDAQTEKVRIDNAVRKYNQGWISQDEASLEITGHEARETEPRNPLGLSPNGLGGGASNPMTVEAEPGANRLALAIARNATAFAALLTAPVSEPPISEIEEAEQWWRENAPSEAVDLIDAVLET